MKIDNLSAKINKNIEKALNKAKDKGFDTTSFQSKLQAELTKLTKDIEVKKQTETAQVKDFTQKLTSVGALAFYQNFNQEKIEKLVEEKREELMRKLGLDENKQPPLEGKEKQDALSSLEELLRNYQKEVQKIALNQRNKEEQNTMLSSFLMAMG